MYTQCPDCSTAFRVTADILRQAAGKVRCGGCGNAFNALDYLSETMPERPPPKELEKHVPELTPEPLTDSQGPPASISAEQSAALLKTLDELAGSDIRIEDTGVEWRVLDDAELGEAAADTIVEDVDIEDQPHIDEILEDSPTPVDQFLTRTPPEVDAPEIFAQTEEAPSETPVDELRFDDHTPLPDDFGLDEDLSHSAPERKAEPEPVMQVEPQTEIDLSDPDEWTDILDEFESIAEELAEPEPEIDDEPEPTGLGEDEVATRDALANLAQQFLVAPIDTSWDKWMRRAQMLTFAAALKAFLRQDPNIIMLGEIRDLETGGIAIKASLTGHLVLSTLHTNDTPSTITRLIDMGLEPFNVASALNLLTAQRRLVAGA